MALVKGVNSYNTVAEADAYFAYRLDAAAWDTATNSLKEKALVTGAQIMDDMTWESHAVSASQTLAFPQVGSYFDPKLGVLVSLSGDTPKRVLEAHLEIAYHLLNNDGLLDDTGGVSDLTLGPLTLNNVRNASRIPFFVKQRLAPLLENGGRNTWWRAN
jgi:hypothetical protein